MVSVAQLVRALDCGSSCWGFKSPHSPSVGVEAREFAVASRVEFARLRPVWAGRDGRRKHAPVAQLDRAPGFEPVGCAFESRRAR